VNGKGIKEAFRVEGSGLSLINVFRSYNYSAVTEVERKSEIEQRDRRVRLTGNRTRRQVQRRGNWVEIVAKQVRQKKRERQKVGMRRVIADTR